MLRLIVLFALIAVHTDALAYDFSKESIETTKQLTRRISMDGFMTNSKGHLVPVDNIKPIDKLRDQLVTTIIKDWKVIQDSLKMFKKGIMDDFDTFVKTSAEQYEVKLGGVKGNVSLVSFDGNYKLQLAISDTISFDEQIQAAKALIDECAAEWTQGSRSEVKAIINDAFQVDKEGNISVGRILGLRRLDIKDPKWMMAMEAISNSIRIDGNRAYVRAYERDERGAWVGLPLDIAAL